MLFIDTINIPGEGFVDFKTKLTAAAIIQCYKLGIPCFVKAETTIIGDGSAFYLAPLEAYYAADSQWQLHVTLGGYGYTATIEDLDGPAVFTGD